MKQFLNNNKKIILGVASCLLIGGLTMSFQTPFGPLDKLDTLTELQDTIPEPNKDVEKKMSMDDYDHLMSKMDKEILKMQEQLGKMDLTKMHQDIAASLDKLDLEKIRLNIDKAIKEVDFSKIEKGVNAALKDIDWNKLNKDVKRSLQDASKEIDKINMDQLKKEMEKAKVEIEQSKHELEKINFDEILKNANKEIIKAKEELKLTKAMFNEMEKEGLINQKNGFTIEFKNKELLINGKKQNQATTDKYRKYIKGDSFKISIGKD